MNNDLNEIYLETLEAFNILLDSSGGLSDNNLVEKLENNDLIRNDHAFYLHMFIPLIVNRMMLDEIVFPNYYFVEINGKKIMKKYYDSKLFVCVEESLKRILSKGVSKEAILKIAGRSPEFKVINDLLLRGENIEGIVFTPLYLIG